MKLLQEAYWDSTYESLAIGQSEWMVSEFERSLACSSEVQECKLTILWAIQSKLVSHNIDEVSTVSIGQCPFLYYLSQKSILPAVEVARNRQRSSTGYDTCFKTLVVNLQGIQYKAN